MLLDELSVALKLDDKGYNQKLDAATQKTQGFGKSANAALGAIAGAGISAAVAGFGKSMLDMASKMETNRIAFAKLLGGADAASAKLKELQTFAANTPFNFQGLVETSKRLMAMGLESEKLVPTLRDVGNAVSAMGGSSAEIGRATDAIGKMLSAGRVTTEEMNRLTETMGPAFQVMADEMGMSVGELRKNIEKGAIDAKTGIETLLNGFRKSSEGMMDAMSATFTGQMSNMEDQWEATMTKVGEALLPMASQVLTALQPAFDAVTQLADAFVGLDPQMQTAIAAFSAFVGVVGPAAAAVAGLVGLIGGLGPVLAGVGIGAAVAGFLAFRTELTEAAIGVGVFAAELVAMVPFSEEIGAVLGWVANIIKTAVMKQFEALGVAFGWIKDKAEALFNIFRSKGRAAMDAQTLASKKAALAAEQLAADMGDAKKEAEKLAPPIAKVGTTAAAAAPPIAKVGENLAKVRQEAIDTARGITSYANELDNVKLTSAETTTETARLEAAYAAMGVEFAGVLETAGDLAFATEQLRATQESLRFEVDSTSVALKAYTPALRDVADAAPDVSTEIDLVAEGATEAAAAVSEAANSTADLSEKLDEAPAKVGAFGEALSDFKHDALDAFHDLDIGGMIFSGNFEKEKFKTLLSDLAGAFKRHFTEPIQTAIDNLVEKGLNFLEDKLISIFGGGDDNGGGLTELFTGGGSSSSSSSDDEGGGLGAILKGPGGGGGGGGDPISWGIAVTDLVLSHFGRKRAESTANAIEENTRMHMLLFANYTQAVGYFQNDEMQEQTGLLEYIVGNTDTMKETLWRIADTLANGLTVAGVVGGAAPPPAPAVEPPLVTTNTGDTGGGNTDLTIGYLPNRPFSPSRARTGGEAAPKPFRPSRSRTGARNGSQYAPPFDAGDGLSSVMGSRTNFREQVADPIVQSVETLATDNRAFATTRSRQATDQTTALGAINTAILGLRRDLQAAMNRPIEVKLDGRKVGNSVAGHITHHEALLA